MKSARIILASAGIALSGCVVVPAGPGPYYDYGYGGPGYFYDYGYAWPSVGVVVGPGGRGGWGWHGWDGGGRWGGHRYWR